MRWRSWLAAGGAALAAGGLVGSALRAREIPFSPVTAGVRVGADFVERRGLAADAPAPAGEMDDMGEYARPARDGRSGFDPERVHPAVRTFYERTGDYAMVVDVRWHRPFRSGAALAAPLTTRIAQLNLPGPREVGRRRLSSRFVALDPAADPRDGARAWVRTDDFGVPMFVALYASHVRDGERFVNIAAPLPGCNLSTVLRIQHLDTGDGDATGVALTTRAAGDPGLYLVRPPLSFDLPLDQRFRVWPADCAGEGDAPADLTTGEATPGDESGEATAVASHEMWVAGAKFLTVEYAVVPA